MRKLLIPIAALSALFLPATASAELPVGVKAPMFRTSVAQGGRAMRYSLRVSLRRGPVVVYFFPKAFTSGCTAEAHAFAEAIPDFKAAGATVVGLSADDLPTLQKFSTEECRSMFPVGVASPLIIKDFDVALTRPGAASVMSKRTSFVIAKDGTITTVYSSTDYRDHVKRTLAAVRKLGGKR